MGGIPDLLVKLKDVPDFYVDMTWEFTSWLPLVSRLVVFSHLISKVGQLVALFLIITYFDFLYCYLR